MHVILTTSLSFGILETTFRYSTAQIKNIRTVLKYPIDLLEYKKKAYNFDLKIFICDFQFMAYFSFMCTIQKFLSRLGIKTFQAQNCLFIFEIQKYIYT